MKNNKNVLLFIFSINEKGNPEVSEQVP